MFTGFITALITPFKNNEIDWPAFDNFVEWQIEQGIHGLVPCGTTGESPTLTHDEHKKVVERCIAITKGRVPVIAGTGSNSTHEALDFTQEAKAAGADGALVVTPYYNKPSQEGMLVHFSAVQDIGLPVIIYNIPGRCIVDMSLETMAHLAKLPNIVGVKDATNDLVRPTQVLREIGPDFCQLTGENDTVAGFLAQGGHGSISVTSNVTPAECVAFYDAWMSKDMDAFAAMRDRLGPLSEALFCETSPAPVKYACSQLGLCTDEVRLPIVPATENARTLVNSAMDHAGINTQSAPKAANG